MSCYLQSLQAVVVVEIKNECIVMKLHEMDILNNNYFSVHINLYKIYDTVIN